MESKIENIDSDTTDIINKFFIQTSYGNVCVRAVGKNTYPLYMIIHGSGTKSSGQNYEFLLHEYAIRFLNIFPLYMVAFDCPGYGESSGLKSVIRGFSEKFLSELIFKLTGKNNAFILMGHSQGGNSMFNAVFTNNNITNFIVAERPVIADPKKFNNCKIPILFIYDEEDDGHPIKQGREMTRYVKFYKFLSYKESGDPYWVSDKLIEEVLKFLNEHQRFFVNKEEIPNFRLIEDFNGIKFKYPNLIESNNLNENNKSDVNPMLNKNNKNDLMILKNKENIKSNLNSKNKNTSNFSSVSISDKPEIFYNDNDSANRSHSTNKNSNIKWVYNIARTTNNHEKKSQIITSSNFMKDKKSKSCHRSSSQNKNNDNKNINSRNSEESGKQLSDSSKNIENNATNKSSEAKQKTYYAHKSFDSPNTKEDFKQENYEFNLKKNSYDGKEENISKMKEVNKTLKGNFNKYLIVIEEGQEDNSSKFDKFETEKENLENNTLSDFTESLNCPLCIDVLIKPIKLDCSHMFCFYCIEKCLIYKPHCPLCRSSIKTEKLASFLKIFNYDKEIENKVIRSIGKEEYEKRFSDILAERKAEYSNVIQVEYGNLAEPLNATRTFAPKIKCKWILYVKVIKTPVSLPIEKVEFYINPHLPKCPPIVVSKPPYILERNGSYEFELEIKIHFKKKLKIDIYSLNYEINLKQPKNYRNFFVTPKL